MQFWRKQEDHAAGAAGERGAVTVCPLRLWPGLLVVAAHATVFFLSWRSGISLGSSFLSLAFASGLSAVLLALWWLTASRAPWRDRFLGFVLFAATAGCVVLAQGSPIDGVLLAAYALPIMTAGTMLLLLVARGIPWASRRRAVAVFLAVCAALFAGLRVEMAEGNTTPRLVFRWSPSAEGNMKVPSPTQADHVATLPAHAGSGDWPGFRGPTRDGRVTGVSFSTNWGPGPRELWRRKVGPAWSSFAAVGDYVFTQEQCGSEERATCYRADTGDAVWENRANARPEDFSLRTRAKWLFVSMLKNQLGKQYEDPMSLRPHATPMFSDGKLFIQGATGLLQCLDASTGRALWKRLLTEDAGSGLPDYGFSSSPLVEGGRVYAFAPGSEGKSVVAAYDCTTGKLLWRAGHGTSGYSSPHWAVLCGVPQIVMPSDLGVQSFAPDTGAMLWEHEMWVPIDHRCTQPLIVNENHLLLASPRVGSRFLRIEKGDPWQAQAEWTARDFRPFFNDCVFHEGLCYGFDEDRLVCVDLKTGSRRWESGVLGGQLLLVAEMNLLLVLTERGEVVLAAAQPERFQEIAQFKALHGKTWNHPVISHGRLFVRNAEEAACFALE